MSLSRHKRRDKKAFTLIELLIVVAIIAILAAIAVPNFLNAQTRSKVARVKADQRTLATALEEYAVEYNNYPDGWAKLGDYGKPRIWPIHKFVRWRLTCLTTPIAYTTSLPTTPFLAESYTVHGNLLPCNQYNVGSEYDTVRYRSGGTWYTYPQLIAAGANPSVTQWHLRDAGPDHIFTNEDPHTFITNLTTYDPSNGTVSCGDIWRFGP